MANRVSDQLFRAANRPGRIMDGLERVADRTIARATKISRAEGGKANYTKRKGVRPNGRVYVDVVSDSPAEEYGDETTRRIGALRRVGRGET